ncbi:MAG TPA: bifunctional ADP-heptose synthase [Puia sp.]|nr:bifunctional ADP-heptose synthase [Puia sp.]
MALQENIEGLFKKISELRVGVIGDVMLDTYLWGHVERISPEAPVPVVSLDKNEHRVGGAGNVALNSVALARRVSVISVTGDDEDAILLGALLSKNGIDITHLLKSAERITTNKTRIISRNQQMLRVDAETTRYLNARDEQRLIKAITKFIGAEKPQVLILEDYNKGVLTEKVIAATISLAKKNKIVIAVDPKKQNFFSYRGADIFKPNVKEVQDGLNVSLEDANLLSLKNVHSELAGKLRHGISLITLSEKGVFYHNGKQARIIPSHVRNVADVSGAGDTVIAVASLVYAASGNAHLMAEIANIAGGLVCEEVGTIAINADKLVHECGLLMA